MFFLKKRINDIKQKNLFRVLPQLSPGNIDLCSNDYLGVAKNKLLQSPPNVKAFIGATGSRLISGNSKIKEQVEKKIAEFHQAESALIFNSGYSANLGLLSCLGQKGDTIIYDELSHASIRDGIRLSFAFSFFFKHNSLDDLALKLDKAQQQAQGNVFVVVESLYSMDGDHAPLIQIVDLCKKYNAYLVVDEAHSLGVYGAKGLGLCQDKKIEDKIFARVYTYGKAFGLHSAAILGKNILIEYLINTCRPFIFSTALTDDSFKHILEAYKVIAHLEQERQNLFELINYFNSLDIKYDKCDSHSQIQGIKIAGIEKLLSISKKLASHKINAVPIRYPTVKSGEERLRISLHSFNTKNEIKYLVDVLNH